MFRMFTNLHETPDTVFTLPKHVWDRLGNSDKAVSQGQQLVAMFNMEPGNEKAIWIRVQLR